MRGTFRCRRGNKHQKKIGRHCCLWDLVPCITYCAALCTTGQIVPNTPRIGHAGIPVMINGGSEGSVGSDCPITFESHGLMLAGAPKLKGVRQCGEEATIKDEYGNSVTVTIAWQADGWIKSKSYFELGIWPGGPYDMLKGGNGGQYNISGGATGCFGVCPLP